MKPFFCFRCAGPTMMGGEFEAEAPACPRCGATDRPAKGTWGTHLVVPVPVVHWHRPRRGAVPADRGRLCDGGPLTDVAGRRAVLKRWRKSAAPHQPAWTSTCDAGIVTCPACRAHPDLPPAVRTVGVFAADR